jgi:hypothetical protein
MWALCSWSQDRRRCKNDLHTPLVAVHSLSALLFILVQALLSNMESMFSSPDLQLPSCDVRDVARAHILAAEIPTASGR